MKAKTLASIKLRSINQFFALHEHPNKDDLLGMDDDKNTPLPPKKPSWLVIGNFCAWLITGAVFYVSDELDKRFGLWLLIIPMIGLPALIASGFFLTGIISSLWTRRWRTLCLISAAPALTYGLLLASFHYQVDTDWLHFQWAHDHYEKLARALPGPAPKYHEWDWGGTGGAASANIFYTLIYDESDNPLHQPLSHHQGTNSSARSFGKHFFLVTDVFE